MVDALPSPVIVLDARAPGWPILIANAAFDRVTGGHGPAGGRFLHELTEVTSSLRDAIAAAADGAGGQSLKLWLSPDGPESSLWSVKLEPLCDGDGVWGVLAAFSAEPGSEVVQGRGDRIDVLTQFAQRQTGDGFRQQLPAAALACAVDTTGAQRGVLLVAEQPDQYGIAARIGADDLVQTCDAVQPPIAGAGPAIQAWSASSAGEDPPVWFAGQPGWEELLLARLSIRGGEPGVVVVADPQDGAWDDAAAQRLQVAAAVAVSGLDRARLDDQLTRLQAVLQGAVSTTAGLVDATDPAAARAQVLDGLVFDMGLAGAALWVSGDEGDSPVLLSAAGVPSPVRQRLTALPANGPVARVAQGERIDRVPEGSTVGRAWPGHRVHLVPVPPPSAGVLGVFVSDEVPRLVEEVFASLAHALASAVQQTTLHRRAQSVLNSLQRELWPRLVDLPPEVEVGHVYQSATTGFAIGGDFFDVFATASGHIGIACGDVSGKGIEAASLTAMAVYSLRAYALRGTTPNLVMTMMNGTVGAQSAADRFMTMVYARIDPLTWTVALSLAGHPPPMLVGPDGVVVLALPPDVPIGMLDDSTYDEHDFVLDPGQSLVLYTDGVTEARKGPDEGRALLGIERLEQVLTGLVGTDAQCMADGVWEAVQEWTGGNTTDDCAILVLRRPIDHGAGESLSLS